MKIGLAKAQASRQQAKVDLHRLKRLLPKKISTEDEVAKARTVFDLAIAEEKRQRTRLQRSSIYAPIDGLITRRLHEPGDMLSQHSHILSIIDPAALKLTVPLAGRWLPLVEQAQQVMVFIDALGNRKITARVLRIHPTVNASTHNGIIEILIDPVPEGATEGQFARANIELKANKRLVIPVHSIHYEPEGVYVFRMFASNGNKDYTVEKVYVEQGQQFNDLAEILSGLEAGDLVVSRGYIGLRDGKKVVPANLDEVSAGDSLKDSTTPDDSHP